jgi:hypothetical protein
MALQMLSTTESAVELRYHGQPPARGRLIQLAPIAGLEIVGKRRNSERNNEEITSWRYR